MTPPMCLGRVLQGGSAARHGDGAGRERGADPGEAAGDRTPRQHARSVRLGQRRRRGGLSSHSVHITLRSTDTAKLIEIEDPPTRSGCMVFSD